MQSLESAVPPPHREIRLPLATDAQYEFRVNVIPDGPLDAGLAHARHVDVPAVDPVAFGRVRHQSTLLGFPVRAAGSLDLIEGDPLLVPGGGRDARVHHQLDDLLGFERQLPSLRFFQPVLGRRDTLQRERLQELDRSDDF